MDAWLACAATLVVVWVLWLTICGASTAKNLDQLEKGVHDTFLDIVHNFDVQQQDNRKMEKRFQDIEKQVASNIARINSQVPCDHMIQQCHAALAGFIDRLTTRVKALESKNIPYLNQADAENIRANCVFKKDLLPLQQQVELLTKNDDFTMKELAELIMKVKTLSDHVL